jgi:hypothetical protein
MYLFSLPNRFARLAAIIAALAAGLPLLQAQGAPAASNERSRPSQQVLRSIDDPAFGGRWLLVADPEHPGGPGRLVPADLSHQATGSREARPNPLAVMIRAGDRLLLEAHTRTADTWLDAVALGPARDGASLLARVRFDNRVVRVVATAPGRATLVAPTEDESRGWAQ